MAKRSPILGYNHNARYRGIVFHVQTEDSGLLNPHVFSHLFHGGVILSTRKLVYDPDATEEVVKALMQSQHKAVLRDLRRGTFDDKIDLYLAGTAGLLPRDPSHAGGAMAVESAPAVGEVADARAMVVIEASPAGDGAAVAAPVVDAPAPVAPAEPPAVFAPAEPPAVFAPAEPPAVFAPAEPPRFDVLHAAPLEASDLESSAPAIEVIEGRTPLIELPRMATPRMDLELPPGMGPALELDDAPFESVTARSLPPVGALEATERVPVVGFPDGSAPAPPDSLWPEPDLSEPELLDSDLLEPALPEPALPEPAPVTRSRPITPPPTPRPTPQWIEPPAARAAAAPIAVPVRAESSRTGPLSPVRVSFVSARGPAPPFEPIAVEPPAPPARAPLTPDRPPVVVPLDAIETPPSGVATFDDLASTPLPPPPPLPTRGGGPPQGGTPVHGVATVRPLGQPSGHDTVPRLAGVPTPTPPRAPAPHAPPPMMAVPAPSPSPYAGHASSPTVARPGSANLPRVPMHTPAIEDDELLAAVLTESNDVAEIHAPPLPSATAPPGSQPERPGEYYVTRTRADLPPPPRSPVTPPRASPGPTRPQASSSAGGAFRGAPPPTSPPPVARPGLPRAPTRPTAVEHVPAPPPLPATRADVARPQPMAPAPRPAPVAARPQPRPRPTTGAGVVVSRPAVIVGAPTQPSATPLAPARPRRARDTGADGMISERSLDEVILAYLSEDGNEE